MTYQTNLFSTKIKKNYKNIIIILIIIESPASYKKKGILLFKLLQLIGCINIEKGIRKCSGK